MTNVVHLRGVHEAMHPRHYVRVGQPLTEADIDAQIASNRERFHDSMDHFREYERRKERVIRHKPSLIPLDGSMLARAIRALRWACRLTGPRP